MKKFINIIHNYHFIIIFDFIKYNVYFKIPILQWFLF